MTNQEVIAILSELKKCYLGGIVDALDFAIEAVKEQEPMQIIKVGYYDHGKCPKCDRYVSRYSNFCWYCGQVVKWE